MLGRGGSLGAAIGAPGPHTHNPHTTQRLTSPVDNHKQDRQPTEWQNHARPRRGSYYLQGAGDCVFYGGRE